MCFAVMSLAIRPLKNRLWIVSVLGAIAHNVGQIIGAVLITSTWQIVMYLPILIFSAVLTGTFTGLVAGFIVKRRL